MLHAVIMAGGAGTRFWPASRAARPKQLLDLAGDKTMIQATVDRLEGLVPPERVLVVTNRRLVDAISEQLPGLPDGAIFGEPCKRDTAPCIGLACVLIGQRDDDASMVVMPADHVIRPAEVFRAAISYAAKLVDVQPDRIVTFGIKPTYPAESFGYIERGEPIDGRGANEPPTFAVKRFCEKPCVELAHQYVESGNFYWNSGIFVWKSAAVFEALARFEPEMYAHIARIQETVATERFPEVLESEFAAIQGKSIDYAVMERYENVVVIEAPFEWDDVGNWRSLARMRGEDADGNTIMGKYLGLRTGGCIIRTDDRHLVVTLGVRDLIVVHTPDATLVANKHDEESLRQIVQTLKDLGWDEYL